MRLDLPVRHRYENARAAVDLEAVSQASATLASAAQACITVRGGGSCRNGGGGSGSSHGMTAARDIPIVRSDCPARDSSLSTGGVLSDFSSRSASAFALGAADLALSVSLHCARSRSDQHPQLFESDGTWLPAEEQSAVGLPAATAVRGVPNRQIVSLTVAASSSDGSLPCGGNSSYHAASSHRTASAHDVISATSGKTSASDASRFGAGSAGRPRDLVEASRARRIDPRDLVLEAPSSAAPWALSACEAELESATLALSHAVASLSRGSIAGRAGHAGLPSPAVQCGHLPLLTEDVWIPDTSSRDGGCKDVAAAAWCDATVADPSAVAAAAAQWVSVGEHPLVASLSLYTAAGGRGGFVAEPADSPGGGAPSRGLSVSRRPVSGGRNPSLFAPDQLPGDVASTRNSEYSTATSCSDQCPIDADGQQSEAAASTEALTAAVRQAAATLPRSDASRSRCRPSSAGPNFSSRVVDCDPGRPPQRPSSAAHHGSLNRRCRKSSMPLLEHARGAVDRHRPESPNSSAVESLPVGRAFGSGSSAVPAAAADCCDGKAAVTTGQRRSFSGFGGGFVSFLERMGRSLSSTDRLRRVSLDSGAAIVARPGAVAAVESEACARRLSEAAASGTVARCSTSSPELSSRLTRKGSTTCVARSSSASKCRSAELGAVASPEHAAAARDSLASSIAVCEADGDNRVDCCAPAGSGVWKMASDRCDLLLSLLAEKPTSEVSAHDAPTCSASSTATKLMPSPRGATPAPRPAVGSARPSSASPAPANTHLLQSFGTCNSILVTVPPVTADDSVGFGDDSTVNADTSSLSASSPPLPAAGRSWRPTAALHKPLSSTPARATLIMNELVQTEADYVAALRLIVDHYLPACEYASPAEPLHGQTVAVFGNVEDLYDFHSQHFFHELCRCQRDPFSVGRTFLDHKQDFEAYALYIKNKPRSDAIMSQHGAQFFKARQEQLADQLDLGSYLLKPIQRLGKYALIVQQLVKECSVWVEAAACAPDAARLLQGLRRAEEMLRFCLRHGDDLLALESLRDCDVDVASQGQLLRQEQLTVTRDKKRCQRQVFLFEKVIIFSKIKKVEKGHDIYKCKESVSTRDVGLTASVGTTGARFELWCRSSSSSGGRGLSWIVDAPSVQSKQAWVEDIGQLLWRQAAVSRQLVLAGRLHVPTKPLARSVSLRSPARVAASAAENRTTVEAELYQSQNRTADSSNGLVSTVNHSNGVSALAAHSKSSASTFSHGENSPVSAELQHFCSPDPWTKLAETAAATNPAGVAC